MGSHPSKGVHLTPEAIEVMRRSIDLAGQEDIAIRLRRAGGEIRPRFATEPSEGDIVVEADGLRVFVDPGVLGDHDEVEIAVTPEHETLVVRPTG